MSTMSVDTITDAAGTGPVDCSQGVKIGSGDTLDTYTTTTVTLGGSFTGSSDATLTKIGNKVTLTLNQSLSHSSGSVVSSSVGIIPSAYRPTTSMFNIYYCNSTGVLRAAVDTAGTLSLEYFTWTGTGQNRTNSATAISMEWIVT